MIVLSLSLLVCIAGPDGSPVDIEIITLSSQPRSLLVRWGEVPRPLRNGLITQYDVRYEPLEDYNGEIRTRDVIVDESDGREITLIDLEEDTLYNVSIQAFTVVGEGPFSEEFTGRTSEGGQYVWCVMCVYIYSLHV